MLYALEQGRTEEYILKQCKQDGIDPAKLKKISNAPQLGLGLELYYSAFWELGSCRQIGMGVGPIPWTAVAEYATILELQEEQAEDLHFYLSAMDSEYLKWSSRQSNKK